MSETEYLFYHVEKKPVAHILPQLLEKTLERGWRALVRLSTPEFLEAIDTALWTWREESFLPHGTARDGFAVRQPVFLTLKEENPNGAHVLFALQTASAGDGAAFARVVRIFEDADDEAKAFARGEWKALRANGRAGSYWKQDENGRWVKAG